MTKDPWKLSTFVLSTILAGTLVYATAKPAHADTQPKMQTALALLRSAKQNLEAASHDKGGHRVKALQATDEAIEQVKKGIEFDNSHDGEKK